MPSKNKNSTKPNAVYIKENAAAALGIYEGGFQKVFIDEKPVTVTFVDEHEIVPMSDTEKRLAKDVSNIAKKYEAIYADHKQLIEQEQANKPFVIKKFYSNRDIRSIKKQNTRIDLQKNKEPSVLKSCQLSESEVQYVNQLLEKAKGINSVKK